MEMNVTFSSSLIIMGGSRQSNTTRDQICPYKDMPVIT